MGMCAMDNAAMNKSNMNPSIVVHYTLKLIICGVTSIAQTIEGEGKLCAETTHI